VDDIARFVDPVTVLCAYEGDPEDENYLPLKHNYELLCHETDQEGRPLKVIKLPMPGALGAERRLPASYANFYIGNDAVLVPVFGDKNDDRALQISRRPSQRERWWASTAGDGGRIGSSALRQPAAAGSLKQKFMK